MSTQAACVRDGLRFEKEVGEALELDLEGTPSTLWYNPVLKTGRPDILGITPDRCFIIEAKRTYTEKAWEQLERYEKGFSFPKKSIPPILIQACKFLVPGIKWKVVDSSREALTVEDKVVWFFPSYLFR